MKKDLLLISNTSCQQEGGKVGAQEDEWEKEEEGDGASLWHQLSLPKHREVQVHVL